MGAIASVSRTVWQACSTTAFAMRQISQALRVVRIELEHPTSISSPRPSHPAPMRARSTLPRKGTAAIARETTPLVAIGAALPFWSSLVRARCFSALRISRAGASRSAAVCSWKTPRQASSPTTTIPTIQRASAAHESLVCSMSRSYHLRVFYEIEEETSTGLVLRPVEVGSLRQIPALFRRVRWAPGTVNADLGSRYLASRGVRNVVLDPALADYAQQLARLARHPADTATLANVLNVLPTRRERLGLLTLARRVLRPGGLRRGRAPRAGDRRVGLT